ncbi:methyltransferase domain-containing protein [Bdellovibrio sp. BCCA]|uniref:methyltransferase domain-containing protein n=1 Tax=Bdellovibrio sp. BCCA TaxID=3136281 RepID=UPI0030F14913
MKPSLPKNLFNLSDIEILKQYPKTFTAPPVLSENLIRRILNGEKVRDQEFDTIFPPYYQVVSDIHWSSIEVARQIASWLNEKPKLRFIDIGCGVGKLCFLLQILTPHEIHGIEQRTNLVKIAQAIIKQNNLKQISIKSMNMIDLDWSEYDVYYLYNPFQEHQDGSRFCVIENNIDLDSKYFAHYTSEVFRQLAWAETGKMLITYHGFGGRIPPSWRMLTSKHIENGHLELWMKES